MFSLKDSRKLTGLAIVIGVLLLLFAVYVIASVWVDVSETVVTAISTTIGTLGGAHQAAQTMSDRSPNYPNTQPPPPP